MIRLRAHFSCKRKNISVPLRMMLFVPQSSSNGDGEEDKGKGRRQWQQEEQKRFVEIACKGNFCFPEEKGIDSSSSSSSEYYTFGLTDQDGKRYFGFVLRYRRRKKKKTSEEENNKKAGSEEEDAEEEEVAMCVLSSRRFYGLFEEILRAALPSAKALWDDDDEEELDAESLESSELGAFLRATLGASVSNGKHSEGGRGEEEDVLVVPSPNAEPSLRLRVLRKEEKEDLACFDAFLYGSSDDDEEDMDDEKYGTDRMKIDSDKDNNINAVSTSNRH